MFENNRNVSARGVLQNIFLPKSSVCHYPGNCHRFVQTYFQTDLRVLDGICDLYSRDTFNPVLKAKRGSFSRNHFPTTSFPKDCNAAQHWMLGGKRKPPMLKDNVTTIKMAQISAWTWERFNNKNQLKNYKLVWSRQLNLKLWHPLSENLSEQARKMRYANKGCTKVRNRG